MKKHFWIMVKQFLLYLLLDQGVALPLMIPLVIYGVIKGYKGEAMQELLTTSSGALCVMILCSILTIAVFLKKRYVKIKPGRIERSNFKKAAGYAMLIAWGWMFTEAALLQLIGINKLFPEEEEHFDMMVKMMTGPHCGRHTGTYRRGDSIPWCAGGRTTPYATEALGGYCRACPHLRPFPRHLYAIRRHRHLRHHLWLALLAHKESTARHPHPYYQ